MGAIAQLGERNTGSVEVGGSIPPSSTITKMSPIGTGAIDIILSCVDKYQ